MKIKNLLNSSIGIIFLVLLFTVPKAYSLDNIGESAVKQIPRQIVKVGITFTLKNNSTYNVNCTGVVLMNNIISYILVPDVCIKPVNIGQRNINGIRIKLYVALKNPDLQSSLVAENRGAQLPYYANEELSGAIMLNVNLNQSELSQFVAIRLDTQNETPVLKNLTDAIGQDSAKNKIMISYGTGTNYILNIYGWANTTTTYLLDNYVLQRKKIDNFETKVAFNQFSLFQTDHLYKYINMVDVDSGNGLQSLQFGNPVFKNSGSPQFACNGDEGGPLILVAKTNDFFGYMVGIIVGYHTDPSFNKGFIDQCGKMVFWKFNYNEVNYLNSLSF